MNTQQRGLILLMKSAVTQKAYSLPEAFDLEAAYPLVLEHHIAALVYDGACRCGVDRKMPVMQKLFTAYCRAMIKSEKQMAAVERLMAAFDEQGIDYLPLKGCKMKRLYPVPELRTMGDADILIRKEQILRIQGILEEQGYTYDHESDHEFVWKCSALYLELHKRLIPSYNRDFYSYFGEGWQLAIPENGCRYTMTAEDEMVFLFTHFTKHFRDGGIGCRYMLDLWVYRNAHPDLNEEYLQDVMDRLQIREFYENILHLLELWFGDGAEDEKLLYITDFIFASGSWGRTDQQLLSQAVKHSKYMAGRSGRLHYIWETLFPSAMALRRKYTILQKAPWMLPVVWLIRPFYKVIFEWPTLKKQQRNLKVLDQKAIDQRQQMLRYVGLDYNF